MLKDHDWSAPYCGVSHKIVNGWQLSINRYDRFCTVFIYDWQTYTTLVRDQAFFTENYNSTEEQDKAAKTWAENQIWSGTRQLTPNEAQYTKRKKRNRKGHTPY